MNINLEDKYATKEGLAVEIRFIDGRGDYPVIGYVGSDTTVTSWTADGKYRTGGEDSHNDLVKVEDWADLEIDDVVEVNFELPPHRRKRHYAGDGMFYRNGMSSKTAEPDDKTSLKWKNWRALK